MILEWQFLDRSDSGQWYRPRIGKEVYHNDEAPVVDRRTMAQYLREYRSWGGETTYAAVPGKVWVRSDSVVFRLVEES